MTPIWWFLLALIYGLVLLPHATMSDDVTNTLGGANNNNPLIDKACASALYKDSFIQTLKSQPRSGNADMKTLAFLSLNVTRIYGKAVADWISQKLEGSELGPEIEQALTDCNDQYTDAMAQLNDSLVAFFSNAENDVKTWMSTAMTNADTCEEGLKGANAGDVMGNRNQEFSQYCSNALAVNKQLEKLNP